MHQESIFHPEFHPGSKNVERGAVPGGTLPRPDEVGRAGIELTTLGYINL